MTSESVPLDANYAQAVTAWLTLVKAINSPRSIALDLRNNTPYQLTRSWDQFAHGGWNDPPLGELGPNHGLLFSAVSDGGSVATGVEGKALWDIAPGPWMIEIDFDNPWAGSNSGSARFRKAGDPQFQADHVDNLTIRATIGVGNDCHMLYELSGS